MATLPLGKVEEQLRQLMEEEVGLRLEPARREEGVLVFDELAPWRVEGGWAARALEEDTEMMGNGDAVLMCRLPDGRFLGALSDGMGHGLHAHMESTRTLELLRLCLQAGYTVEQTLTRRERHDAQRQSGGGICHGGPAGAGPLAGPGGAA